MHRQLAGLLLALALSSPTLALNLQAPLVPDPVKTPGDMLTSDPAIICVPGYTKSVRSVSQSLKEQVYRSYGITSRDKGEYEIDHLVSLELGGSNSVKNLWPQSYKTLGLNAHVKDRLENKLHDLACAGTITFTQAQTLIAHNWESAYAQYVCPLPGATTTASTSPAVPAQPISVPQSPGRPAQGADTTAATPNPDGSCPSRAPIKGSKSKIYHLPTGDGNYTRTHAQACFTSAAAAQSAGYRAVR